MPLAANWIWKNKGSVNLERDQQKLPKMSSRVKKKKKKKAEKNLKSASGSWGTLTKDY